MNKMIDDSLISKIKRLFKSIWSDEKGNVEVGKDLEVDGNAKVNGTLEVDDRGIFSNGIIAKEDTTSTTDSTTYNGNHISRVRLSKVGGTSASYNYALPDKSGTLMLKEELLDTIYPVGCIYISTTSTSPASFMPNTTWEKIEGKFLIGSSISYPLGTTGGEATHTLTVDEMPSHSHVGASYIEDATFAETQAIPHRSTYLNAQITTDLITFQWESTPVEVEHVAILNDAPTSETGGNLAHNNIPPYLSVSIWKRTK